MSRILILDDEPAVLCAMAMCVSTLGHEAIECSSPVEALRRMENEEFSLLITDQCMPMMTGLELASTLRSRGCTVPILLVTARWDSSDFPSASEAGISAVLVKPFDFSEFKKAFEIHVPGEGGNRHIRPLGGTPTNFYRKGLHEEA